MTFSQSQINATAEALRQHEQGGRILRPWADLPNHDRKKWLTKACVVLGAVEKAE